MVEDLGRELQGFESALELCGFHHLGKQVRDLWVLLHDHGMTDAVVAAINIETIRVLLLVAGAMGEVSPAVTAQAQALNEELELEWVMSREKTSKMATLVVARSLVYLNHMGAEDLLLWALRTARKGESRS